MKGKYLLLLLFIISLIGVIIYSNKSYAYTDNYDYTLFYKEDYNELENNIKVYLKDIDYLIYNNSDYTTYNTLSDNYEFMINFALDYISINKDKYNDKIVIKDNYNYIDRYNNSLSTNEYISIDTIYDITYKYFGKKDFIILNDNVNVIDNYISLSSNKFIIPNLEINNISISKEEDKVIAKIKYVNDNNTTYYFIFNNIDGILKITNVEVEV